MNEGLRVLLVLDGLDLGGTETHVLSLAKEMSCRGIHVVIASRGGQMEESFRPIRCPMYKINFPKTMDVDEEEKNLLVRKVEEVIEKERISIIHAHQTPSGYITSLAAKKYNIPIVFTVHGTYYPKKELIEMVKMSTAVITVSPPIQRYVQKFTSSHPTVIPNGIDTEEFTPTDSNLKASLGIPDDAIVVLYASRLAWAKARICMMLLRACKDLKAIYPNLYVVVAGDGPRLKEITELTNFIHKVCNQSFIRLVGQQTEMTKYYSIADCVVGTGRVALEAMSCKKAVIAVGNHGYFGIVKPSEYEKAWDCYFGDHGSREGCGRYILGRDIKLLFRSMDDLEVLGVEGRKFVEEKFNIKNCVSDIVNLYTSLLKECQP